MEAGDPYFDVSPAGLGNLTKLLWPFAFEEVTSFVRLDGKHPPSGYSISRVDRPYIDKIENVIVKTRLVLQMFYFSKLFVISSYFFS